MPRQQATGHGKINPVKVQKFLKGIDYPVDKKTLIEKAKGNGADENVMHTLQRMSRETYNGPKDVSRAIGALD